VSPKKRLLTKEDGPPVTVLNAAGTSDVVLVCDHAGRQIPAALGTLGLSERELGSHIAWDIGARGVAESLADRLDAPLVLQHFSRLVIDCNRLPSASDSITTVAEWGPVSGNEHLEAAEIAARHAEIFVPYHDALAALLDKRKADGRRSVLLAIHSFTPSLRGIDRPWHVGVMHGPAPGLATAVVEFLRRDPRLDVGVNQPFALDDEVDYTLPHHGAARGIPHLGIEIRQDLVADEAGQKSWAGRLASLLRQLGPSLSRDG
jgi:predicted N-formylglutamate amidohydrolase